MTIHLREVQPQISVTGVFFHLGQGQGRGQGNGQLKIFTTNDQIRSRVDKYYYYHIILLLYYYVRLFYMQSSCLTLSLPDSVTHLLNILKQNHMILGREHCVNTF